MKSLHKAAMIRAYRTFLQALLGLIPMGVTVDLTVGIDWKMIGLTILSMICTALITGCISFIQAIITGLPEVDDDEYIESVLEEYENMNGLGGDE